MKQTLLLAILLPALFPAAGRAQTTLRLRYGGHLSAYRVVAISGATPAEVTVVDYHGAQRHEFAAGDQVYVHTVPGCQAANGYRTVGTADQSAGTFSLLATDGSPVVCAAPFESKWGAGWVGKVQDYTLNASPRLFLPQSGDIKTRMTDPDGSGPQVAPAASENGPAWQGLINHATSGIPVSLLDSACDGLTDAACPNAALHLGRMNPFTPHNDWVVQGADILNLAAVWYADNSKTKYLAAARYYINNYERVPTLGFNNSGTAWLNVPGFPCDDTAIHCGHSSGADWISFNLLSALYAFDVIRDQLTSVERETFAAKIMNGWDGSGCTNSMVEQAGTITTTSGSKSVTGSGFSVYSRGDWIYLGVTPRNTGRVNVVDTVTSDDAMTLYRNVDVSVAGVKHYKINPWTTGSCGALYVAGGHIEHVGAAVPRGAAALAANITSSATSMTVASAANFLDAAPFVVWLESEALLVTNVAGTTLTIERGYWGTTPAAHSSGRIVTWSRKPGSIGANALSTIGPFVFTGQWSSNVHQQKQLGYLIAGLALADIDARAVTLAERMWNYFYDLTYPYNKDYWTGPTQGGMTQGYLVGRFPGNNYPYAALASKHAFTVENSIVEPYLWRYLLLPVYLTVPGYWQYGPQSPAGGDAWSTRYWYTVGLASAYNAGAVETEWANYWYKNLANLHISGAYQSSLGLRGAAFALAYIRPTDPATDFRSVAQPWKALDETDFDATNSAGSGYGIWVSKTDFTASASAVYAPLGYHDLRDHNLDYPYVPGSYHIYKGDELLIGDDSGGGFWGNPSANTNYFEVAGGPGALKRTANWPAWFNSGGTCDGGQKNRIDLKGGETRFTHARGNFGDSYCSTTAITRALRHIVHLKSGSEYFIVFDNFAAASAKQMRTRINYWRRDEASNSPVRDGTSISFRKSKATISTKLLFPDGSEPSLNDSSSSNAVRTTIDWGEKTSAQMIAVHRVSAVLDDVMPAAAVTPNLDEGSTGVEIVDGSESRAVIFSRDGGLRNSAAFGVNFDQQGQYLILDLAAGRYRVQRSGDPVEVPGSPFTVTANDGSLMFEGLGGSYTVYRETDSSPALAVNPSRLTFSYEQGGPNPAPQSVYATCSSGMCDVTVNQACSWALVSPSSGSTPRAFTVEVNASGMPPGTHLCEIRLSAEALNSPQTVVLEVTVTGVAADLEILTGTLLRGTVENPYSAALEARGGTPPYTWSVVSGALPEGLALGIEGTISGTPEMAQTAEFEAQLADSASPPATLRRIFSLTIDPRMSGAAGQMRIRPVTCSKAVLYYGDLGLLSNESCTLKVSPSPTFDEILETLADGGGPSKRVRVLGEQAVLSPGTRYYVKAECATNVFASEFKTRTAGCGGAGTVRMRLQPPAGLAQDVLVEYGGDPQLGSTVTQGCASGCTIDLPAAPDRLLYLRYKYLDSAGNTRGVSPIRIVSSCNLD